MVIEYSAYIILTNYFYFHNTIITHIWIDFNIIDLI